MESRKIFSKLNIKDYNNELEKILDNKLFSLDVKNILLSMLYKIENNYADYENVKVEVIPKKEFIQYLLKIIKEKCNEIEFIKTREEDLEEKKEVIDIEQGTILCYPNEISLLSSIWYMGQKTFEYQPIYEYIADAVTEMMQIGNNVSSIEVIRDFSGWSWEINTREIHNITYNFLYQSLLFLNDKNIHYLGMNIALEEEEYKEENIFTGKNTKKEEEILIKLYEIAMKEYLKKHQNILQNMIERKNENDKDYALMQNKREFIQMITDKKKENTAKIEKIDKIINSRVLLQEEYTKRNAKLPNKEKIFSISHLADGLEKEREGILEEIKRLNKILEPKEFVIEKEEKRKEVELLKHLELEEKMPHLKEDMVHFCKLVLKRVETKLEKIEERKDILHWIYKIRYYAFLPIDEEHGLKDIPELSRHFEKIVKLIIKKAQQNKLWDIFTEDEKLTYQVLKEIFTSKMIDLRNANIACRYEDGILYLQYYDANMLEKETKLRVEHVKIKKKIKLFI